jgi:hypothetical protein
LVEALGMWLNKEVGVVAKMILFHLSIPDMCLDDMSILA